MSASNSINLVRAIAFHFRPERLPVLAKVVAALADSSFAVKTIITTNSDDKYEISMIERALRLVSDASFNIEIVSFPSLSHPWLLPWAHKQLLSAAFSSNNYTHFIYTEDDIALSASHVMHWLQMRESFGEDSPFYPSFLRIEYSERRGVWCFTDLTSKLWLDMTPKLVVPCLGEDLGFYSLPNSYQAMYIYDRKLMQEYIEADEFNIRLCKDLPNINHPKWGGGGVAEASALGICHKAVPVMFHSRNLTPIYISTGLPHPGILVHHASNSYCDAGLPEGFGTIAVSDLKLG